MTQIFKNLYYLLEYQPQVCPKISGNRLLNSFINYDYYINGDPTDGIWGGQGSSSNPNDQTYHGTAPFSEIENQAIKWFVEQHNFVMAFNNHSYISLLSVQIIPPSPVVIFLVG